MKNMMRKMLTIVCVYCTLIFSTIQNISAYENRPYKDMISMDVALTNTQNQIFEVELRGEKYTIRVEDVPMATSLTYTDIDLPSHFTKKIYVENNGVLEGKAFFTGTSTSTKGTVTDVTGATLTGPLITGVSWQKNLLTLNDDKWGVGQAIYSYSFIVVGGSASLTLQLTAQPNGKGVIALF